MYITSVFHIVKGHDTWFTLVLIVSHSLATKSSPLQVQSEDLDSSLQCLVNMLGKPLCPVTYDLLKGLYGFYLHLGLLEDQYSNRMLHKPQRHKTAVS